MMATARRVTTMTDYNNGDGNGDGAMGSGATGYDDDDDDDEVDDDCDGATRADDNQWGAGGSASSLEGRWRRLLTRGRPHWSRAFNNAGDGTGTSRGKRLCEEMRRDNQLA
jgi:hypothetical protein